MTATPPDPQPDQTPGLEEGGGVRPGDTPPGEASTSGNTFREPDLPSEGANKAIAIGLVVLVVVVTLLLFVRPWN
jgi:hypothetical protein